LLVVLLSTFAGGTPLKKEINTPSPKRIWKKNDYQNFISLFNEPVSSKILFSLSLLVEKHKNKIINFETITPS
jgi:hypothetical protein